MALPGRWEGRTLGFAFQPGVGMVLGGMAPSPRPAAAGHLGGRPKPILSCLAPAARHSCLVFGASQHPQRRRPGLQLVGAGCLHAPQRELLRGGEMAGGVAGAAGCAGLA